MLFFQASVARSENSFYSIQISSNASVKSAENEVSQLKAKGYNAFYRHRTVSGTGDWYTVYIGRYGTREEAAVVVESVKNDIKVNYKSIKKVIDRNIKPIQHSTNKPPVTSAPKGGNYALHVSSFMSANKAKTECSRLKKMGLSTFFEQTSIKGKTWNRVYVGSFNTYSSAAKKGNQLKRAKSIAFFKVLKKQAPTSATMPSPSVPPVTAATVTPATSTPKVDISDTSSGKVAEEGMELKDKYLADIKKKQEELAILEAKKAFDDFGLTEESTPGQIRFKDLMNELLAHHDTIKYAKDNIVSAEHMLKDSKSGYLPSLDLTSDYGYERISKEDISNDSEEFRSNSSLRATQLITDFGLTSTTISKSKSMVKRAQYELEASRQRLLLEGTTVYLNLIRNREILKYFKKSEANVKKQTGIEETLVEKGAGLSSNVLQAKAQLSNSRALVAIAKGALETSRNNFRALFKRTLTKDELEKLENPPLRLVPTSIDTVIETSLKKNLTIALAKLDARILAKDVRIKRSAYYPQLNFFADDTYSNNEDGIEGYKNEASLGIEFTYNLYRGGGDKALINAAQSSYSAATHLISDTRHRVEEQARNAWQNLETLKTQTRLLEDQANIAGEFLKLARKERRLGNRSLLDILNGEITYINAVSSAISSKIDMKLSVYNLLFVTGQLNMNVL